MEQMRFGPLLAPQSRADIVYTAALQAYHQRVSSDQEELLAKGRCSVDDFVAIFLWVSQ